jgi:hypothetical protein
MYKLYLSCSINDFWINELFNINKLPKITRLINL